MDEPLPAGRGGLWVELPDDEVIYLELVDDRRQRAILEMVGDALQVRGPEPPPAPTAPDPKPAGERDPEPPWRPNEPTRIYGIADPIEIMLGRPHQWAADDISLVQEVVPEDLRFAGVVQINLASLNWSRSLRFDSQTFSIALAERLTTLGRRGGILREDRAQRWGFAAGATE